MNYANEAIINALKKGREAQGLSQRELSARTGLPQSHISKIESGSADIRLSSLTELARALGLEVTLVPRKALPAVESIVRSTAPAASPIAVKELRRTLGMVGKLRLAYPDLSALNKLQGSLRTLSHFREIDQYLETIKTATQPLSALQKQLAGLQQIEDAVPLPSKTIKPIEDAANHLQDLINQLVHTAPSVQQRPAYRLDEDDDDPYEHKELGDG